MVNFDWFLETCSLQANRVTRLVTFNRTKIGGKCQNWKTQMRHIGLFQTQWTNLLKSTFNFKSQKSSFGHKMFSEEKLRFFQNDGERESHLDFISLFGLNLDFSIPIRDVEKMVEGARTSRLWVKSTLGRRGFSSRAKIIWPSAFSLSIIRSGLLGRS